MGERVGVKYLEMIEDCINGCVRMYCPEEDTECIDMYWYVCEDMCLEEMME